MKKKVVKRTSTATEGITGVKRRIPMKTSKWRTAMLPNVMVATNEAIRPNRTAATRIVGAKMSKAQFGAWREAMSLINAGSDILSSNIWRYRIVWKFE